MTEEDIINKDILTVWEEFKALFPDEELDRISKELGCTVHQAAYTLFNYLRDKREHDKRWIRMHTEDGYLKPDDDPRCNIEKKCIVCGEPFFVYEFNKSSLRRKYCSIKCKTKMASIIRTWRNRLLSGAWVRQDHRPIHICIWCRKEFRPTRIDAGFCSPYCRLKAHRDKEKRSRDGTEPMDNGFGVLSVSIEGE